MGRKTNEPESVQALDAQIFAVLGSKASSPRCMDNGKTAKGGSHQTGQLESPPKSVRNTPRSRTSEAILSVAL